MKLKVTKTDVWAATIKDRAGGLAQKMAPLAKAGANLKFVIARRVPGKSKKGVVFVTPINGTKQTRAAKKAGFTKTKSLQGLRVIAADRAGLGAKITRQLAEAKINLRGFSGASLNKRAVFYLAFDRAMDVSKATRILKAM